MARTRKQQSIPIDTGKVTLMPERINLADEELVHVARLVRLLRTNYWLSHFVKMVLAEDGDRPLNLTIKDVQNLLDQQRAVETMVENIRRLKSSLWSEHPAFHAIREEWDDIDEYQDAESIRKLVESANLPK